MLFQLDSAKSRRTVGVTILNFVSPAAASAFVDKWQGRKLVPDRKAKPLDIAPAPVQGYRSTLHDLMRLHFREKFESLLEAALQRRTEPIAESFPHRFQ